MRHHQKRQINESYPAAPCSKNRVEAINLAGGGGEILNYVRTGFPIAPVRSYKYIYIRRSQLKQEILNDNVYNYNSLFTGELDYNQGHLLSRDFFVDLSTTKKQNYCPPYT